ncbi:plasmid fertility inhibition factor family protein [Luteimonas soli]|uniref:Plasmid fertility inhibition factor family protein n=1 Tax=Luteimonas soli TaxID=1648966 RepID=A0ABV7XJL7_9GAMM
MQREIRLTEASIARRPPPAPAQLVGVVRHAATWRLAVPSQLEVLVKVDGGQDDVDRYVVHVDADAFYLAMLRKVRVLRTSAHGSTCMARRDMPRDYKYARAAAGFAHSATSPVPLAQPVVGVDGQGRLQVDFNDGITRTYWLLANGCSSFPVEVHGRQDAYVLAKHAGVGIECFADLFATGAVHASSTAAA